MAPLAAEDVTPELEIAFGSILQYRYNVARPTFADQVRLEDPFATLDMKYVMPGRPGFRIGVTLQREWTDADSVLNLPAGIDGNPLRFENNFVTDGVLLLPVGDALITFGRQKIHIGPDETDSLSASQQVPYYDALLLEVPVGALTLRSVTSTIENRQATPDVTASARTDDYAFGENIILYNIHYFEYEWTRVRAGIGSQVLIARAGNNFQLGDFFPVFSWHNADVTPNNMSLITDVSVSILPSLEAYLQIGLDDISGSSVGIGDGPIPTIDAYLAGIAYRPLDWIASRLQFGYTHYLWGNFNDNDYLARAIYRWNADDGFESMPLTSPWGPGALWVQLDGSVALGDLIIAPELRLLGTNGADLTTTPYAASDELEGASRTWANSLAVEATYSIGELFIVGVRPAMTFGAAGVDFSFEATGQFAIAYRN